MIGLRLIHRTLYASHRERIPHAPRGPLALAYLVGGTTKIVAPPDVPVLPVLPVLPLEPVAPVDPVAPVAPV